MQAIQHNVQHNVPPIFRVATQRATHLSRRTLRESWVARFDWQFLPGGASSFTHNPGDVSVKLLYSPAQRSELNTVPGLLGLILAMTMVMFTAVSIVRERERGNMELLIATPVKTVELMLGKLASYVVIGMIQMGIILWLGWLLFQVPVAGSWILLVASCLVFIFSNLGLGLLLSTFRPIRWERCSYSYSFSCPRFCFPASCFPIRVCRLLHRRYRKCCR